MRKRGEIVWLSVDQALARLGGGTAPAGIGSIEVGVRHVGPVLAQRAMRSLRRLRLDETKRVLALRAELGADGSTIAPELYGFDSLSEGEVKTPEGEDQLAQVCREIFALEDKTGPLLGGTKGLEVDGGEVAAQIDDLERLNLLEVFLGPALEVQDPTAEFRAADAGAGVAGAADGSIVPDDVGA